MRWWLFVGLIFIAPVVLIAVGIGLMIEEQPAVTGQSAPSTDDVARAREVLRQHDPRTARPGEVRKLALTERDLNLVANYAMNVATSGAARGRMRPDVLDLALTLALPRSLFDGYLNTEITVRTPPASARSTDGELRRAAGAEPRPLWLTRVSVGRLEVPVALAEAILDYALGHLLRLTRSADGVEHPDKSTSWRYWLTGARIESGSMTLVYRTPKVDLAHLREALVAPAVRDAMAYYQGILADQGAAGRERRPLVDAALTALFRQADARSANGADPVTENRALLIVLGAHASGRGLTALVPEAADWPLARPNTFTLHGRQDYAQHFLASAALAAVGGSALADLVGLYKEIDDASVGSGFSFTDYLADRAGTRFGQAAVASPEAARRFQREVGRLKGDDAVLPPTQGLPEGLSAAEFDRRFGPVGSPAYRGVVDEIDRRIAALRLYAARR